MPTSSLADVLARAVAGQDLTDPAQLVDIFRGPDKNPDALLCALLFVNGADAGEEFLRTALSNLGTESGTAARLAAETVTTVAGWQVEVTGAEATAALLAAAEVGEVFVYAGTSELALCDALERTGGVRLVNGRGDKESAFMASGASLIRANRGAAVLHGARGLTNAMGAVADARRSEVGALVVVGLPSSGSARFLPPHGERDLIDGAHGLADWHWQAPAPPADQAERDSAAGRFIGRLREALAFCANPPHRPALFGVPQDVAEQRWIPLAVLSTSAPTAHRLTTDRTALEAAVEQLAQAERPLLLVDDYALRHDGIRPALDTLATAIGAPVLQVRYRRGPMLFERLRSEEVSHFVGWLNQFDPAHMNLLDSCDLLITVEDRNIYERVVGRLPGCRKIAVNTDPEKVLKNEYLEEKDLLVAADPAVALAEMAAGLESAGLPRRAPWFGPESRDREGFGPERPSPGVLRDRRAVVRALADTLGRWERPVLVDDSQMFGGLIAEHYDELPAGLRVFGGHGAFVGSGLSYAAGLAVSNPEVRVMCTLGDQAFTNSFQGLVAVLQQRARVTYVVCNNGESASLNKQGRASLGPVRRPYLANVNGLSYHAVAEALGIPAVTVAVPVGAAPDEVDEGIRQLTAALAEAGASDGPALVELVLPSAPEAWEGIWLTHGFEQQPAAKTAPAERSRTALGAAAAARQPR